jgi:hypothetical protein
LATGWLFCGIANRWDNIDTNNTAASQALAIDVFATFNVSAECDKSLGALARECGLPENGTWTLKFEWNDPDNRLREPSPTPP